MTDSCRTYEVDGEPVRVRGEKPMTEEGQQFLTEVIRAAKRRMETEDPAVWERQAAARARIRARIERLR